MPKIDYEHPAIETIEARLIAAVDEDAIITGFVAKAKAAMDEAWSNLQSSLENNLMNDVRCNVKGEATRIAERMLDAALLGDETTARQIFGPPSYYHWQEPFFYPLQDKYPDCVKLRRMLLEANRDLFQSMALDDYQMEVAALKGELRSATQKIAAQRREIYALKNPPEPDNGGDE